MRVATIVGARPQFIKMAPVSLALKGAGHAEISIHTGQHYDSNLSDVFYRQLGLRPPDHNLEVGSGGHGAQTARMLARMEPILEETRPDWVLVIGDTNSTLAGALIASKLHLRLAHIEAGLRSFDRRMPEEVNRICADHLSDRLYFATRAARDNLEREGLLDRGRNVGDVSFDAVRLFARSDPDAGDRSVLDQAESAPYVLLTLHRAETTDDPECLRRIWLALSRIPERIIFPIHPRTRAALERQGLQPWKNLVMCDPVGYPAMLRLLGKASLLLTDSGGLQKESYFLRVPCLTLRRKTEWVETVRSGWNRLYDIDACPPIDLARETGRRGSHIDEFGDGTAADRIVADLQT